MMRKIDVQNRKYPGASLIMDGGGPVLSAWVAHECSRVSGQELTEEAERWHADPAREAKERKLVAWKQFKVLMPVKMDSQSKDVVDTRWALTWREAGGAKTVRARLVAKGYQDPELR